MGIRTAVVAEPALTPSERNIEVHVDGSVTGQLVVGDNNLLIHADHGALVNVLHEPVRVERRPVPVQLPPRPFPGLLGRTTEIAAARATILVDQPFEFYAAPGWGKTALLRYLGPLAAGSYPDGIVYQPAAGQPLADLQQFIFDAFYQPNVPFKPTTGQLRQYLQPIRALVLLDDLDLTRDELDALLTSLPRSVFLLASKERSLWGAGQAQAVSGLSREAGLALFERELGRLLTPAEQPAFDRLNAAVEGNPLDLLEGAALMRDRTDAFGSVVADQRAVTSETLTGAVVGQRSEDERKVLGVLTAVSGADLPAAHVADITGIAGSPAILERLAAAGLAEMQDDAYRLKVPAPALGQTVASDQWTGPIIEHFARWAGTQADNPHVILEAADPLLKVLDLAGETKRPGPEVVQLARGLERPLAQAARWGAWQRVLNRALQAAQAMEDRPTEAWARHQLGTRSLCLGEYEAAGTYLNQALTIRKSLGDREGTRATQHNLDRLKSLITPYDSSTTTTGGGPLRGLVIKGLAVVIAAAAAVIGGPAAVHALFGGQVTLDPSQTLNAGLVSVGKSGMVEVQIHNTGRGDLVLLAIPAPAGEFQQSNNCPTAPNKLKAGATCTVEIRFVPTQSGVRTGELVVTEQGGQTHQLRLTGTGTAPKVSLAGTLEFGLQPAGVLSAAKDVALRNDGNEPLPIKTVSVSGDFRLASTDFPTPDCPRSLPAGQVCHIAIKMFPAATGVRTGTLTISDSLGTQTVALSGTGILTFTLSPSPLDFGIVPVGRSLTKQVILTNTSGLPLAVGRVETSTKEFLIETRCQQQTVLAGQTCLIVVRFVPVLAGTRSDNLVVTDTDGDRQQDALSGVVPVLGFNPSPLNFATAQRQILNVTNVGQAPVMVGKVSVVGGIQTGFRIFDDNCSNTKLSAGARCVVVVDFAFPGTFGAAPANWCGQLHFVDDDPSSPQDETLQGWGKCE